MSNVQEAPAGWTLSRFKAVCADVGSWTWGTVQGAFNEKASLSQIIVDAVIGMIPLVGDATAVRDLIAVIIGLSGSEEKRNSKWEWVLLVVLLFALIPIIGGVIKGVGRITVKVAKSATSLSGPAKIAHMRAGAVEVVEFLNRIGVKNAEKWLLSLRISDHTAEVMGKLKLLTTTLDSILEKAGTRFASLPNLKARIISLRRGIGMVRSKADEMIPMAIRELDQQLRDIQAFIRTGGESTSRVALHRIASGERVVTRVEERRMIEQGTLPTRTSRGGFKQNPALISDRAKIAKIYQHENGYPDLLKYPDADGVVNDIAAFSGKMTNRALKNGEQIFRFFGPECVTHGVKFDESFAGGAWWGVGSPPKTAKEWRELAAVLDGFNGDGFFVTARVVENKGPNAVIGTVSEQFGAKIPGQYLPGGATQAVIHFDGALKNALKEAGQQIIATKKVNKIIDMNTGLELTFHKSGWTDANGIWGYANPPSITTVQTARVGSREQATKENRQVTILP